VLVSRKQVQFAGMRTLVTLLLRKLEISWGLEQSTDVSNPS
jgi:hypothetical protein